MAGWLENRVVDGECGIEAESISVLLTAAEKEKAEEGENEDSNPFEVWSVDPIIPPAERTVPVVTRGILVDVPTPLLVEVEVGGVLRGMDGLWLSLLSSWR